MLNGMFGPCRGCAAKDQEIERLSKREAALLDRVLAKAGESPLPVVPVEERPRFCPGCSLETGQAPLVECAHEWHKDEPAIVLTQEQEDEQAQRRLAKIAERRELSVREFADA